MEAKNYDLIVIGAGSGGIGAVSVGNRLGLKTLLIDKKDFFIGGDCLNFGCIPSKALIHISKQFHAAKTAQNFGLKSSGKADILKVLDYIHQKQDIIRKHENAAYFREQGIDVVLGTASFADSETVQVDDQKFKAQKIVIATGSRPRQVEVKGIEKVNTHDNESLFFELKDLPKKLLVIGGGPIGCEMAQAFRRLGSEVVITDRGSRLLNKEREEISAILTARFEQEGIEIIQNAEITEFPTPTIADIKLKDKSTKTIDFDVALVAVGRVLNIEDLHLKRAGIKVKEHKIVVDEYLRTSNPKVFTAGDISGKYQFSHGAEKQVRLLWYNFISPFKKKHDIQHLSWVTFTDPEVATFGYSEKQLKEKQIEYELIVQDFEDDDRAIVDDYRYGKLVLYLSKKSLFNWKSKILGGTMIAPYAGELVQELILANYTELNINKIFDKVYPYPVAGRINQKAISTYRQKALTGRLKKLLGWLYKL